VSDGIERPISLHQENAVWLSHSSPFEPVAFEAKHFPLLLVLLDLAIHLPYIGNTLYFSPPGSLGWCLLGTFFRLTGSALQLLPLRLQILFRSFGKISLSLNLLLSRT
jgi:hypothetical protein